MTAEQEAIYYHYKNDCREKNRMNHWYWIVKKQELKDAIT